MLPFKKKMHVSSLINAQFSELMLEASTVSKDVPYGDCFTVDTLMVVSNNGENSCLVRLAHRVHFSKTAWGLGGMPQRRLENDVSNDSFIDRVH
jgi:hypothetical protein